MAEVNAGLGSLADLKQFLLANSMNDAVNTANDVQLTAIGLGVAGMFAEYCNREWAYGDAWADEATANRSFMVARHYPIDLSVPMIVERCDGFVANAPVWTAVPEAIYNVGSEAGTVYFAGYQGNYLSRLRLKYAGGYWWAGLSDTKPDTAEQVPENLKLAWLLQCQSLWLVRDDLGTAIAGQKGGSLLGLSLPGYSLVPEVKALLNNFIRYGMSA